MKRKAPQSTPYFFEFKGQSEPLPLVIRKRKGARRMVLRYQPITHALALTLPPYVSIRRGLSFVEEKRSWVLSRLEGRLEKIPFADGQVIPVLGVPYRVTHAGGRGVVRIEGDRIIVSGDSVFLKRRMREWIKKCAAEEIKKCAEEKAARIGRRIKKITLRDTRSLWGSCSRAGNLSFSWRLVFAPPEVLDYLVAHEVAHLREHNHGQVFWKLVAGLCPHWKTSRAWIKKHGETLYRYG
jgi:predicted metal-dependent hydrolase